MSILNVVRLFLFISCSATLSHVLTFISFSLFPILSFRAALPSGAPAVPGLEGSERRAAREPRTGPDRGSSSLASAWPRASQGDGTRRSLRGRRPCPSNPEPRSQVRVCAHRTQGCTLRSTRVTHAGPSRTHSTACTYGLWTYLCDCSTCTPTPHT